MYKKYALLVFCLFVLSFCKHEVNTFPKIIDLKGKDLQLSNLYYPKGIYLYDSILIIKEKEVEKKSIKLYNINNYEFISSTGILGKGPGEMVNPAYITNDINDKAFWCQDWGKCKIFKFYIDSVFYNPNYKPKEFIPIKKGYLPIPCFSQYKEKLFAFSNFQRFITFFNEKGEIVDSLEIPNKSRIDFWNGLNITDYNAIFEFNPDKTEIVVANSYENYFNYIDINGNILFEFNGEKLDYPINGKNWEKYKTYVDISTNDKYVFLLYSGK